MRKTHQLTLGWRFWGDKENGQVLTAINWLRQRCPIEVRDVGRSDNGRTKPKTRREIRDALTTTDGHRRRPPTQKLVKTRRPFIYIICSILSGTTLLISRQPSTSVGRCTVFSCAPITVHGRRNVFRTKKNILLLNYNEYYNLLSIPNGKYYRKSFIFYSTHSACVPPKQ